MTTRAPDQAGDELSEQDRIAALQQLLLAWYARHQRDLPWRQTRDPYHTLLSEMMLQQTQVPRVLPRYLAWLAEFPTLAALAAAPTAAVLRAWSGLGYNSRAIRLQAIARQVVAEHGGQLPTTVEALRMLPGIGEYTAHAVACFAFGQAVPVLDTNVKRVLQRVVLGANPAPAQLTERQLWSLAWRALPAAHAYDWNQALMDLGSAICTARRPACLICPLRDICLAAPTIHHVLEAEQRARAGAKSSSIPFTQTNRYFRGQILRTLAAAHDPAALSLDEVGPAVKADYSPGDRLWLHQLVTQLARDGLVTLSTAPQTQVGALRETPATYDVAPSSDATEPDLARLRVSLPESEARPE